MTSPTSPECYVWRLDKKNVYFPAKVVKETKSSITVKFVISGDVCTKTFNKIKCYQEYLNPRTYLTESLRERTHSKIKFYLTFATNWIESKISDKIKQDQALVLNNINKIVRDFPARLLEAKFTQESRVFKLCDELIKVTKNQA